MRRHPTKVVNPNLNGSHTFQDVRGKYYYRWGRELATYPFTGKFKLVDPSYL